MFIDLLSSNLTMQCLEIVTGSSDFVDHSSLISNTSTVFDGMLFVSPPVTISCDDERTAEDENLFGWLIDGAVFQPKQQKYNIFCGRPLRSNRVKMSLKMYANP